MGKAFGWLVPLVLGVLAAGFYLAAVRSAIRPIDLIGVAQNVRAGTELTEDMLVRVSLRADRAVVRSVPRWEDRGLVIGRRVGRSLVEGELVLFADVRQPAGETLSNLRAGEASLTLSVPAQRIVPGVRIGDEVLVVVLRDPFAVGEDPPPEKGKGPSTGERAIGPFRVVGFGERPEGVTATRDEPRPVVVAVKIDAAGAPADRTGRELSEAVRGSRGEKVVAVEFPGPVRGGK